MASILNNPLPQLPQALDGLSKAQIAAAFQANPTPWIKALQDYDLHLYDLYLYAVHLQDEVNINNGLHNRA